MTIRPLVSKNSRLCRVSLLLAGGASAQTVDGGHSHSTVATPDGGAFTGGTTHPGSSATAPRPNPNIPTEVPGSTQVVGLGNVVKIGAGC